MNSLLETNLSRLLHRELRWLMQLRWIAGVAVAAAGVVNWRWGRWYPMEYQPVVLGGAILAYNALFGLISRGLPLLPFRSRGLFVFASAQIFVDLACLVALTLWTGGLRSPVLGFFFFHMIFASLVQHRGWAYATGLMAITALGAGLWATGRWPHDQADRFVAIGWATTMLITVFLTDRITRALYRRELARARKVHRMRSMSAKLRAHQHALIQSEKMSAMGQMAAGIAHEINNPLASMDSVLQLMQRNPGVPRPESVSALREQIQRIHRTVRQLTSFAHPGHGDVESVSINSVVRSCLEMLALNRRVRGIQIESSLAEDLGIARTNPHALQQVLTNLVMNAIDATADSPAPRIIVRTARSGDWAVVEVADTGTGIAPENIGRVFEPFFTTKPIGEGTGLGLSISARLVRDQGGQITVASELGRGTTFTVRLPLEPGAGNGRWRPVSGAFGGALASRGQTA